MALLLAVAASVGVAALLSRATLAAFIKAVGGRNVGQAPSPLR